MLGVETKAKGYSPLLKEVRERIESAWEIYIEEVGLEGDAYKVVRDGYPNVDPEIINQEIRERVGTHRIERDKRLAKYRERIKNL